MFFALSKILGAVLAPLNLVFLILFGGAVTLAFSRALGRSIMALGLFLFAVFGLLPIGQNMLAFLEKQYERPAAMPERVQGILVLGGTFITDISEARGVPALNETAERLTETMALARRYPDALVVFSGGDGRVLAGGRTEADDVASFLSQADFPDDNVIYEDASRNTYENIRYTQRLVFPQPDETWLLVTSAYHMPRAMGVARAAGWGNIIPYPVDYRTAGYAGWLPHKFDLLGNMYDMDVALHEYLGLAAYQLSGKIYLRQD